MEFLQKELLPVGTYLESGWNDIVGVRHFGNSTMKIPRN